MVSALILALKSITTSKNAEHKPKAARTDNVLFAEGCTCAISEELEQGETTHQTEIFQLKFQALLIQILIKL